jgi:hypothetical protein
MEFWHTVLKENITMKCVECGKEIKAGDSIFYHAYFDNREIIQ